MMKPEKSPALLAGGWLALPEALALLGRSQSTLERLVATGVVESKLEPRAGRKPERLYAQADLARLQNAAPVSSRALAPAREQQAVAVLARPGADAQAARNAERVSITVKLWLTLAEAGAYSGLGEAYLAGLVKAGKIAAAKGGAKGSWVIRRKSLEEYGGG